jgi:molybdenum cofactor biosynthesis enzyme MoaA
VVDFVELTRERPLDVRFIEYMPFEGNGWNDGHFLSFRDMLAGIEDRYSAIEPLGNEPSDTARQYHVPGFRGRIGFITSMSEPFCSTCDRLRITADGNLKVCLFGAAEVSLRDALRSGASDAQLVELIAAAVGRKMAAHAGMEALPVLQNRPMILIGG